MKTVIIAEDEKWVRQGIIKAIDWEGLSLAFIGEAANGTTAYKMIIEHKPDIALLDIRMPGMSGLDIARKLKQEGLTCIKTIIISGYSLFEYAQEAIQHNVNNYILKPIKKDELNRILKDIIEELHAEEYEKAHKEHLQGLLRNNDTALREKMFDDSIEDRGEKTNKVLNGGFSPYYTVLVTGFCFLLEDKRSGLNKYAAQKSRLIEIIRSIVFPFKDTLVYEKTFNCFLTIVGTDIREEYKLLDIGRKIIDDAAHNNMKVAVGVGKYVDDFNKLQEAFSTAHQCYCEKLFFPTDTPITLKKSMKNPMLLEDELINDLVLAVEFTRQCDIKKMVDAIFKRIENQSALNYNNACAVLVRLNARLNMLSCKYNVENRIDIAELMFIEGLAQLKEYIVNKLYHMSVLILQSNISNNKNPVERVIGYLNQNYMLEFSLEQLADYVHLNPSYLSDLFKREIGVTIIDYITNCRVERAKDLMLNTNMKFIKIAEMVGYKNPHYFSKVFKKHTGKKPSEFRGN